MNANTRFRATLPRAVRMPRPCCCTLDGVTRPLGDGGAASTDRGRPLLRLSLGESGYLIYHVVQFRPLLVETVMPMRMFATGGGDGSVNVFRTFRVVRGGHYLSRRPRMSPGASNSGTMCRRRGDKDHGADAMQLPPGVVVPSCADADRLICPFKPPRCVAMVSPIRQISCLQPLRMPPSPEGGRKGLMAREQKESDSAKRARSWLDETAGRPQSPVLLVPFWDDAELLSFSLPPAANDGDEVRLQAQSPSPAVAAVVRSPSYDPMADTTSYFEAWRRQHRDGMPQPISASPSMFLEEGHSTVRLIPRSAEASPATTNTSGDSATACSLMIA